MARPPFMKCWVAVLTLGLAAALTITSDNQQGTGRTPCQESFLTGFYKCIGDNSLDTDNFLYLITDKTIGQAPADEDVFRTNACGKKDELTQCMNLFMSDLMETTTCQDTDNSPDQRTTIERQFVSLMRSFNTSCSHRFKTRQGPDPDIYMVQEGLQLPMINGCGEDATDCMQTYFPQIQECYKSINIDVNPFRPINAEVQGNVIGTSEVEANRYCQNQGKLFQCMRNIAPCPEPSWLLGSNGMDIDALEKGTGVVCEHVKIYLHGIECLGQANERIIDCMRQYTKSINNLFTEAQGTHMDEELFAERNCEIRIARVDCELNALKHTKCSNDVIGLRTESECALLTDVCATDHKSIVGLCHVDNFKREERKLGGGASVLTTSSVLGLVLVSLVTMVSGRL